MSRNLADRHERSLTYVTSIVKSLCQSNYQKYTSMELIRSYHVIEYTLSEWMDVLPPRDAAGVTVILLPEYLSL